MSRIGRMPIAVPKGVEVKIEGTQVSVKGPKGNLERTFPADSLYADMASDRPRSFEEDNLEAKLRELAQCMLAAADVIDGGKMRLLSSLNCLDPFCQYPELTEALVKELSSDD